MIKKRFNLIILGLIIFYLAIHLLSLVKLPIFADESIYIRWAQLIIDDWSRYLFFPLNDGKTPLFIWFLVPTQFLFSNQLYAARLIAVLIGLAQVLVNGYLTKVLGGKNKAIFLSCFLTTILPFWYFHHRMALMDGLLTLWLSLSLLFMIKKNPWASGIFLGLGLLTKLPAILFVPVLVLFSFSQVKFNHINIKTIFWLFLAPIVGLAIFASLKLNPAFGQLFSRGGDFLYPVKDVILGGLWLSTLRNIPTYLSYFGTYFTYPLLILSTASLFSQQRKKLYHLLFWSSLIFMLPMIILGKVVYPRYFLPSLITLTIGISLYLEQIIESKILPAKQLLAKRLVWGLLVVYLLTQTFSFSSLFIFYSLINPNKLPLVLADRVQYLTEWSSGHGIVETVGLIKTLSQDHTVAVATEGYFGTLPDALLVYFHRQNVDHIYIEGIGQPVGGINSQFTQKAKGFDQTILVVNSHRLNMKLDPGHLLLSVCRPYQAPCLQVWDISDVIRTPYNQNP